MYQTNTTNPNSWTGTGEYSNSNFGSCNDVVAVVVVVAVVIIVVVVRVVVVVVAVVVVVVVVAAAVRCGCIHR